MRLLLVLLAAVVSAAAADWAVVPGRISTRWAKEVSPDNAWREYPRPQFVRERWLNLNGLWEYSILGKEQEWKAGRVENATYDPLNRGDLQQPAQWDGKILVPFCVESSLSGVARIVRPDQILWYRRTFDLPADWRNDRVLLNFEAVDWHATVFVNGNKAGEHRGGYTRFSLDITEHIRADKRHEVLVAVWDPTNAGDQAIGKQSLPEMRQGFRFTPSTGIWQTVWLEPVPRRSIESIRIEPDVDKSRVKVIASVTASSEETTIEVEIFDKSRRVASATAVAGEPAEAVLPRAKLWSPDQPFLYDVKVTLRGADRSDTVRSYFGMRKIAVAKDSSGIARIYLNNKPLPFQFGPLDQGYWPDGILTPPSDKAAAFDLEYLKQLACNMVRVHIKIHPERWYYHCDRLGLLVWQDMVNSRRFEPRITTASAKQWELEQRRMIDQLYNHPSIIQWIVFNESWGQYETERLTAWTRSYDPSRLVTGASGWADAAGVGDIRDIHDYSIVPSIPLAQNEGRRAIVIGEFGGFNVHLKGHLWHADQDQPEVRDWVREGGRERYSDPASWLTSYRRWMLGWKYLIGEYGLNAAVYTQISDVEHETNGWLTYDRAISKIPVGTLRALHCELYKTPPQSKPLTAEREADWRHTTSSPDKGWEQPGFDDSKWESGGAPNQAREAWLRKRFTLSRVPKAIAIRAIGRGQVEAWINGRLARVMNHQGSRGDDLQLTIQPVWPESGASLRQGENVIAVRALSKDAPAGVEISFVELEGK